MSNSRFQPTPPVTPPAGPLPPVRRRQFAAGEILMRQGDPGDCAWLIDSGEVEVILTRADKPVRLSRLSRGVLVGEMALIDQGPRSATVRAVTDVMATELSRATFRRMLESAPPLGGYLLTSLTASIRRVYGMPPEERDTGGGEIRSHQSFSRVLNRRVFRAGHVFFKEEDAASTAYLIQSGRVAIERAGFLVGELGPGRLFGELGILSNKPRAASATALEQTTCEVIAREDVEEALAGMPPILRTLARIYADQIARSKPP